MKLIGKFTALTVLLWTFMSVHAQTIYHDYQDGLVVFQLAPNAKMIPANEKKQVDYKQIDLFQSLNGIAIQEVIRLHPTIKDEKLKRTYQIQLVNPSDVDHVVRRLNMLDDVLYAELKELHRTLLTPNDPRFGPAANQMWGLYRINAQDAWDLTTGDANIKVAVTDDAINVDHPDLVNKMLPGHDATTGGNNPRPCGGNNGFHGSHVSGTVGAETDNNLGVASIGWNVSIMPVKIGRCSDGALTGGYDGVIWATDNGADVINMSWGGGGAGQYGQDVCNYAWNQGSILIAAAGNNNATQQFYPAAYNNVVAVASTTTNDSKSSFSQYGTWINISAPGSSILSTDQNTGYQSSQGTSMASPLVAGFMGLMKSYAPNATNADLVQCLYNGADNIDAQNANFIGRLGAGRMNAYNSLICAQQYAVDNDAAISKIISPDAVVCGSTFTPEVELRNFGGNTLTSVTINYGWNGTSSTFNWTGNLGAGGTELVTLPEQTAPDGSYTFTASTSMPNNQADENPGNDESDLDFQVDANGQFVEFTLELDCYGSDIDWEIRSDETGAVVASGGNYTDITGGQVVNQSYCMPSGCYTFTINDSYSDGLNGSIYNGCSIDGDYRMLDELGNVLFEMTAANADFGAQAIHNFCIVAQDNQNDAGISEVIDPKGFICSPDFIPTVRLRNFGIEELTSVTINYSVNGGAEQSFNWTGSLATGQATNVVLEEVSASNGTAVLNVYTSNPNGEDDDNDSNDGIQATVSILSEAESLPFVEDFESDVFTNGRWIIENPDNQITWERSTVAGSTPGNTAAKMNFFGYGQTGQRDRMISPLISLDGYLNASMTFEHAYRRFDQTAADSLVIYISLI
jgi:subtilisin family serine protease